MGNQAVTKLVERSTFLILTCISQWSSTCIGCASFFEDILAVHRHLFLVFFHFFLLCQLLYLVVVVQTNNMVNMKHTKKRLFSFPFSPPSSLFFFSSYYLSCVFWFRQIFFVWIYEQTQFLCLVFVVRGAACKSATYRVNIWGVVGRDTEHGVTGRTVSKCPSPEKLKLS